MEYAGYFALTLIDAAAIGRMASALERDNLKQALACLFRAAPYTGGCIGRDAGIRENEVHGGENPLLSGLPDADSLMMHTHFFMDDSPRFIMDHREVEEAATLADLAGVSS